MGNVGTKQSTREMDFGRCALVIAGHGSTLNPDSSSPTLEHARRIREMRIFAEVAVCFWKEEPGFAEALRMIDSETVFVVPNFISEGYFTRTVIPREMGLDGPTTRRDGRLIHYCEPAGNHPMMTSLLIRQAMATAPSVNPAKTSLFIVGHGTGLDEKSAAAARFQADCISSTGEYAEVFPAYMEEEPFISDWHKIASMPNVVVVPFFISDGLHSYQDIPVLLGICEKTGPSASQAGVFLENPHHLHGRSLFYSNAIGSAPEFAGILVDQARGFRS
ncbi:MAG: CbiX/SirB N-terminal domain-containing protein [Terrimicrobiaceae bacterium]